MTTRRGRASRSRARSSSLRARKRCRSAWVHELTTNAAKYGALSRTGGRLQVTWTLEPPAGGSDASTLRLAWIERGGPPAAVPRRLGFGSRLLNRVLAAQLQAEVDTRFPPEGFELRLAAPIRGRAKTPFAPPESVRLA